MTANAEPGRAAATRGRRPAEPARPGATRATRAASRHPAPAGATRAGLHPTGPYPTGPYPTGPYPTGEAPAPTGGDQRRGGGARAARRPRTAPGP
jgi:hypothetical protein